MKNIILYTNRCTDEKYEAAKYHLLMESEDTNKEVTENDIMQEVDDMDGFYFDEFVGDCKRINSDDLIAIADLQFWNGRAAGYKEIDGAENIPYVFNGSCEDITFALNRYNLVAEGVHHDGAHSLIIRAWRDDLTDQQRENFLDKLYSGKYTQKDITRYTKSIKQDVKEAFYLD